MTVVATKWWVTGGIVVAVAVAATLMFFLRQPASPPSSASSTPALTGAAVVSAIQARRLESALSSGDRQRTLRVLSVPTGQQLDSKFFSHLAAMGPFAVREESAVQLDESSARVYAGVSHGKVRTWTLLLIKVDGQWLVSSTVEGELR